MRAGTGIVAVVVVMFAGSCVQLMLHDAPGKLGEVDGEGL